jgi:hypothetical protein
MRLWRVPEKVLLPAEPGGVGPFAFNGRLPGGDQVLAYLGSRTGHTCPGNKPYVTRTAVLFRFDAGGVLRTCQFDSTSHGGGYIEQDPERSYRKAKESLDSFVAAVKAEGWASADILVRPFYVRVDGFATGLVYSARGKGQGEGSGHSAEEVRLVPFGQTFHPPWTDGRYET